LAKELYKNIIQRLPAALILAISLFGILYLQNIFLILTIVLAVGFLLIKEWLMLSDSNIDLKQLICFVSLIMLPIYFTESFLKLFIGITSTFWIAYGVCLILKKSPSFISFQNNYLGLFLVLGFLYGLIYLMLFSEFFDINKYFLLREVNEVRVRRKNGGLATIYIPDDIGTQIFESGQMIPFVPVFPRKQNN
jgi:CDP-diglyceride synthetase